MKPQNQSPEQQIAEEYSTTLGQFLEKNKEWWSSAQYLNNGNYGQVVSESLNAASNLLQKYETESPELVEVFFRSVSAVRDRSETMNQGSKMTSQSSQPADENVEFITSIAQQTLDRLQRIVSPEVTEFTAETDFDIREIQHALQTLGFFKSVVDGIPGPATTEAIMEYQRQKKIRETGIVDRQTYNFLMEESSTAGPEPTPPPKKQVNNFLLPLLASEGNHQGTDDKLEFEYDIQSLATVISLKDVKPPLAIGLFGNWGTGKSFFMDKLSQKIQQYSKSKNEGFVKNVVQVKFNSWHYSDSNLWASLITEIFDSLNSFAAREEKEDELKKLSDTLNITSAQREAVEEKRNELTDKIGRLLNEKEIQRSRLEDISGFNILKLLLRDENISNDLKSLKNEHVETIIQSGKELGKCLDEFQDQKSKFLYFARTLSEMKGKRWAVVFIATLVILAGSLAIRYYFAEEWFSLTQWVSGIGLLIAANVGNAFRMLSPVRKEFNIAFERLKSLKETIDSHPEQDFKDLQQIDTEIKSLTGTLEVLDKKIADARKEIEDLKSGRKLLEFIEQRSRDENYSRQLGLISWIRKDFSKLDELLRKQHELSETDKEKMISNPFDVKLQIDRIILYIDDLDRCREEIVVKVLEAIHLLLAFPLFVVVVGVDPRWLNNALSEKYKNLFGKQSSGGYQKNSSDEEDLSLTGAATSYDYLEKIFQIPFSLRQINTTGRKNLIEYLLRNEMEKETPLPEPVAGNGRVQDPGNIDPGSPPSQIRSGSDRIPEHPDFPELIEERNERLTFLKDELECLQDISVLFGHSPRTINRFINIYRIIKAHRKLKVSDDFSEDDFAPIMIVLSIMIGYSHLAQNFIDQLSKSDDQMLFTEFLAKTKFPDKFSKEILDSIKPSVAQLPLKSFKDNLELISRFSFRTFAVKVD